MTRACTVTHDGTQSHSMGRVAHSHTAHTAHTAEAEGWL